MLARAKYKGKVKRYGGYLGGFPERARVAIGVPLNVPMLHACGGLARQYPYKRGFGIHDATADIDPKCKPDFVCDLEKAFPLPTGTYNRWPGILIDPPYSEEDAKNYDHSAYPNPNKLVVNAMKVVPVGGKVGIIHYVVPRCPKNAKFVFFAAVICGFGNRCRAFSVFEREK